MLSKKVFDEGIAKLKQAYPDCSMFELMCMLRDALNQDPTVKKNKQGFDFVVKKERYMK